MSKRKRPDKDRDRGADRRGFITGAAATAAAGARTLAATIPGSAAKSAAEPSAEPAGGVAPPTPQQVDRHTGNVTPPTEVRAVTRPGSDLMVQVLRDPGIDYMASNPASSTGETGARDLVGTSTPVLANVERFTGYLRLRADQAPLFPSTRKPNYPESALTDAEASDIGAFIRSFRLNAPDVDEVPVLQSIIESASRPYEP